MSLQVWLPMTKDLRQQGLSDVEVMNNGATFDATNGKLGGCYYFNGTTTSYISTDYSTKIGTSDFSISLWVKIPAITSGSYFAICTSKTGAAASVGFGIYWNYSQKKFLWSTADGSGATEIWMANTVDSIVYDKWIHLVMIRNSSDSKIGYFYINGIRYELSSVPVIRNIATDSYMYLGKCSSNNYPIKMYLSDFRIYDHALSPMEVKQISQGLVLHYPLDRNGWGQENLMPNSTIMSVGSANPSTGSWRVAGSSQMTRSRIAISDSPIGDVYGCQSVGLQTGQDASCWGIDGFPRENGTTYTISAWGRIVGGSTTAAMLGFSIYSGTTLDYGGTYGQAKSSDTEYYGSGAYDYAGGQLNPNGSWTRIYRTFTSTSTSDNIYIGFNTAKTGNNVTLQLCGVKLEKGDKVTPWCPKSTDDLADVVGLNENIEYDTSGFCNNGTRTGTFDWISNSPRYSVSTKFNTNYIERNNVVNNPSTTAFWIKFDSLSNQIVFTDYNTVASLGIYNNNLLIGYGADCKLTYPKTIITTDKWYHVCIVKSSNTTAEFYLDGILQTPGSTTDYWTKVGTNSQIGARSTNYYFKGNLSDFRIYTTALSANDVKNLYQNSEYIDNSNNVYAATYTEV